MRSYPTHLVPVITAVIAALVSIVAVFRSHPQSRILSSNWRRVGFVTFWGALTAWSVWLLGAIGLVSWEADRIIVDLPWYG